MAAAITIEGSGQREATTDCCGCVPALFSLSAASAGIGVLSHLSARADGSDDYTLWAAEVKKYFSGRVLVAKDLMEF